MYKKMNIACGKALNSLIMKKAELHFNDIQKAIEPYQATQAVLDRLVEKGFVKKNPYQYYEVTPLGIENSDYFESEWKEAEKEVFNAKVERLQAWINTILAVAGFVISILALCK